MTTDEKIIINQIIQIKKLLTDYSVSELLIPGILGLIELIKNSKISIYTYIYALSFLDILRELNIDETLKVIVRDTQLYLLNKINWSIQFRDLEKIYSNMTENIYGDKTPLLEPENEQVIL